VIGGGVACWAHGGPETDHDLDFLVRPVDAERALALVVGLGMRGDRPPEPWLFKAYDGPLLVDLIFEPAGLVVDEALIERSRWSRCSAVPMRVLRPVDLLVTKLMAMTEHTWTTGAASRSPVRSGSRSTARARAAHGPVPVPRAFFALVEGLRIARVPTRRLTALPGRSSSATASRSAGPPFEDSNGSWNGSR
jgi:hypothetical protein